MQANEEFYHWILSHSNTSLAPLSHEGTALQQRQPALHHAPPQQEQEEQPRQQQRTAGDAPVEFHIHPDMDNMPLSGERTLPAVVALVALVAVAATAVAVRLRPSCYCCSRRLHPAAHGGCYSQRVRGRLAVVQVLAGSGREPALGGATRRQAHPRREGAGWCVDDRRPCLCPLRPLGSPDSIAPAGTRSRNRRQGVREAGLHHASQLAGCHRQCHRRSGVHVLPGPLEVLREQDSHTGARCTERLRSDPQDAQVLPLPESGMDTCTLFVLYDMGLAAPQREFLNKYARDAEHAGRAAWCGPTLQKLKAVLLLNANAGASASAPTLPRSCVPSTSISTHSSRPSRGARWASGRRSSCARCDVAQPLPHRTSSRSCAYDNAT
eukprot:scaffold2176_cov350-Prasinococcus_capsulatus_cf.AAC.7